MRDILYILILNQNIINKKKNINYTKKLMITNDFAQNQQTTNSRTLQADLKITP